MNEITMENAPAPTTQSIGAVWASIRHNPALILRHWNYKSAIFSGLFRAPIFFFTYLQFAGKNRNAKETIMLALGAAAAQFAYRFVFAGINGSLIQMFRRVEPAWQALVVIMLLIPAVSHTLEFIVQHTYAFATGTTQQTDEAIVRSICVSIISALFNLFAMRRGLMLVGKDEDRKSIWGDMKHTPVVVVEFVAFIPMEIAKMLRRGAILTALFSIVGFGVFSGLLAWAIRGKSSWFLPWGTGAIILMVVGVGLAAIYLNRKAKQV